MSNVPGAAPPQPSEDVFGGGWLGTIFGGVNQILTTRQAYEIEKLTAKAQANSLNPTPTYQTVPAYAYQPSAASSLENLPWELILIAAGAGLVAIWALRR